MKRLLSSNLKLVGTEEGALCSGQNTFKCFQEAAWCAPGSAHPRVLEAGPQLQVGTEALAWWGFVRGIMQVPAGSTASEPTGGLDLGWAYSVLGGSALVTRCNIAPWVHGGALGALEYVQEGGQVLHRAQHPAGRWRVLRLPAACRTRGQRTDKTGEWGSSAWPRGREQRAFSKSEWCLLREGYWLRVLGQQVFPQAGSTG